MRGFYTVFDSDNGLIGITPHSNSNKQPLRFALKQPTHFLNDGDHSLIKKFAFGAGILLLIVIIYLVCIFESSKICACLRKLFRRKTKQKDQNSNGDDDAQKLMGYLNEKLCLESGETNKASKDQGVKVIILN